jgi:hypothetical protein
MDQADLIPFLAECRWFEPTHAHKRKPFNLKGLSMKSIGRREVHWTRDRTAAVG